LELGCLSIGRVGRVESVAVLDRDVKASSAVLNVDGQRHFIADLDNVFYGAPEWRLANQHVHPALDVVAVKLNFSCVEHVNGERIEGDQFGESVLPEALYATSCVPNFLNEFFVLNDENRFKSYSSVLSCRYSTTSRHGDAKLVSVRRTVFTDESVSHSIGIRYLDQMRMKEKDWDSHKEV